MFIIGKSPTGQQGAKALWSTRHQHDELRADVKNGSQKPSRVDSVTAVYLIR